MEGCTEGDATDERLEIIASGQRDGCRVARIRLILTLEKAHVIVKEGFIEGVGHGIGAIELSEDESSIIMIIEDSHIDMAYLDCRREDDGRRKKKRSSMRSNDWRG